MAPAVAGNFTGSPRFQDRGRLVSPQTGRRIELEPDLQAVTTPCVRQWGCRCPVLFWTGSAWTGRSGAPGPARGHPISDEIVNPDNVGRRQYFTGATIYRRLNEAYAIGGAIRDKWGATGWEQGWLRLPELR
ncbi:hypothetical protein ACFZC5_13835 [Nocardia gamkensis]|uniref:hypothetical protein n=1 Tax=Nocardia gamkensis TaxID=352869 RepID=UPI0036E92D5E